jgi:excinuclease ABC subunit B
MDKFSLHAPYQPCGSQPQAIESLYNGLKSGKKGQVLLGVTGSGKTFTIAQVIAKYNKPTLVLSHNKILAAQLMQELKEFFPENAVEYFVSYYDYYQPESYMPGKDVYIAKDASVNNEIDKMRHSATSSLAERNDVIICASVSCIYSLGDPSEYRKNLISLRPGQTMERDELVKKLIDIQYERNDIAFDRNKFRVRGDTVDIYCASYEKLALRVEFFGDEIDRIIQINPLTGKSECSLSHANIFPASHYVYSKDRMDNAIKQIESDLEKQIKYFKDLNKPLEAERIEQRTRHDIEMLSQIGFCQGIENYSSVLEGRSAGTAPYTLLDHFPKDFLLIIDESHATLPQIRAMYAGDRARKESLVNYGFRLPCAFDNRPLTFDEFLSHISQAIYISATPAPLELELSDNNVVEQIIRPTGLLDPIIEVRPTDTQMDNLYFEIQERIKKGERVMITVLTKALAEQLSDYFDDLNINSRYLHHKTETIERMKLIRELRLGVYDVLIGINLLREGLDIPEVSLIAIMDADKEGFLRSRTSLIQTIGRAARNKNGKVILYADKVTDSMQAAIEETNRRRLIQEEYNRENNIEPQTIIKEIRDVIEISSDEDIRERKEERERIKSLPDFEIEKMIKELEDKMMMASEEMRYEDAIEYRDEIAQLRTYMKK